MSEDSPDSTVTAAALALLSPLAAHHASASLNAGAGVSGSSLLGLQQYLQDGDPVVADQSDRAASTGTRQASVQQQQQQHQQQRKGRKVTRACDTCKARKARCSGTIPCDRCTRRGSQADCHYEASYRRGRLVEPVRVSVDAVPVSPSAHVDGGDRKRRKRRDRESGGSSSGIEVATVVGLDTDDRHNNNTIHHACAVMSPPPEPESIQRDRDTAAPSRASPELDVAEIQGQYYDTTSGLAFLHRALRRFSKHDRHDGEDPRTTSTTDNTAATSTKPSITTPHDTITTTSSSSTTAHLSHDPNPHTTTTSEDSPTFTAGDRPLEPPQTPISDLDLPSLSRALDLVNLYFESSIATFRIIHLPTVRAWMSTLLSNSTSALPLHTHLGKAKAAITLLVLAIAIAHQDRRDGNYVKDEAASMRRSDGFFSAASALLEHETGGATLASAQARIVQVLYLLITSRMNQAWYVFGSVVQLISALGLHRRVRHRGSGRKRGHQASAVRGREEREWQQTTNNANNAVDDHSHTKTRQPNGTALVTDENDYIHLQLRRRTFWTAYIIDKYLGVMFGRPAHYNDDWVDQEMPDSINDEDMTPTGPRTSSLPTRSITNVEQDCHISALIYHAKLAQIISEATRSVYSIRPSIGPRDRIEAATRLNEELRKWQEALPPYLGGAVRPSSLIPVFRRQAVALRINFSHARLHINRLFLLGSLGPPRRGSVDGVVAGDNDNRQQEGGGDPGESSSEGRAKEHVQEAILAAHEILETVDQMVTEQGDTKSSLFHALWWTQYVTFCALATIYAWDLQARRFRLPLYDGDDDNGGGDDLGSDDRGDSRGQRRGEARSRLMELADRCIGHLARATASNSPSRRYAIILDKMRGEVKRQQRHAGGLSAVKMNRTAGRRPVMNAETHTVDMNVGARDPGGDGVERNDFYPRSTDFGSREGGGHGAVPEKSPWEELAYGVGQDANIHGHFQAHDAGFGFMPGSTLGDGLNGSDAMILGTSPSTGYGSSLDGMNWSVDEWQTEDWLNLDAIAFSSFLDA